MVPFARIVADRLLEGEVLLAAKEIFAADRRRIVGRFSTLASAILRQLRKVSESAGYQCACTMARLRLSSEPINSTLTGSAGMPEPV